MEAVNNNLGCWEKETLFFLRKKFAVYHVTPDLPPERASLS